MTLLFLAFTAGCGPQGEGPGGGMTAPSIPFSGTAATASFQCRADVFLDVSAYSGPGGDYAGPKTEVTCTATEMTMTSNGMPHYTYVATTPNALGEQAHVWTIPLTPTYTESTTGVPCLGAVGFAINGIPLYGPNEGPMPDPFGDPVENDVMDESLGHTGGTADYHYHAFMEASFRDTDGDGIPDLYDDDPVATPTDPSPILGYALDGFPIYGSRGCVDEACTDLVTFKSGWTSTNYEAGTEGCTRSSECSNQANYVCGATVIGDELTTACVFKDYAWDNHAYQAHAGSHWLDQCNGRMGADGTYRYHATSTFPYLVGCFHGSVPAGTRASCADGGGTGAP
jgi:hypothetical protein